MNKKQLQEFISAIGSIAKTALLFYRSTLAAKATPEEAMRLTQAFIAAIFLWQQKQQLHSGAVKGEYYDDSGVDSLWDSCSLYSFVWHLWSNYI